MYAYTGNNRFKRRCTTKKRPVRREMMMMMMIKGKLGSFHNHSENTSVTYQKKSQGTTENSHTGHCTQTGKYQCKGLYCSAGEVMLHIL
jgi:hypothetical protein